MTSSMTRKHFQAIANVIRENCDNNKWDGEPSDAERVGRAMASALRQFNPAFDRERFLKACGVDA
jgi:hypothetical protein